jgi:hypothetical protein
LLENAAIVKQKQVGGALTRVHWQPAYTRFCP